LAKLVARLLATTALWVRIQILYQKYKKGDISKGVANTLYSQPKKYSKKLSEQGCEQSATHVGKGWGSVLKPEVRGHTDKNKIKFSSYIRKFRGIGCKVIYD
jgi:hypothetical protein